MSRFVEKVEELSEFKKLAQTFITNRNYESLKYIYGIGECKSSPPISSRLNFIWNGLKSLIDFYFYEQQEEATVRVGEGLVTVKCLGQELSPGFQTLYFNFYYDIGDLGRFNKNS